MGKIQQFRGPLVQTPLNRLRLMNQTRNMKNRGQMMPRLRICPCLSFFIIVSRFSKKVCQNKKKFWYVLIGALDCQAADGWFWACRGQNPLIRTKFCSDKATEAKKSWFFWFLGLSCWFLGPVAGLQEMCSRMYEHETSRRISQTYF